MKLAEQDVRRRRRLLILSVVQLVVALFLTVIAIRDPQWPTWLLAAASLCGALGCIGEYRKKRAS